jgi:hypothetical protein
MIVAARPREEELLALIDSEAASSQDSRPDLKS